MQADLLLLFGLFALTWAAPKPSVDDESRLYDLSNEGEMPTVEENVHENAAESEEENEVSDAFISECSVASAGHSRSGEQLDLLRVMKFNMGTAGEF